MEEELFSEICNEENESLIKHQLKEVCVSFDTLLFQFQTYNKKQTSKNDLMKFTKARFERGSLTHMFVVV